MERRWRRRRRRRCPATLVSRRSSTRMPLSTAARAWRRARLAAWTPMPTTTASQSTLGRRWCGRARRCRRPRATRRRRRAATRRRGRRGDRGRWRRPRRRGCARTAPDAGAITVTSSPRWRAEAATSVPIQPAPIDDQPAAGVQPLAQRVGVGERAQVVDAVELGAGNVSRRGSAPVASSSRS